MTSPKRGSLTEVLAGGSVREGCVSGALGREVLELELGVGVRKREGEKKRRRRKRTHTDKEGARQCKTTSRHKIIQHTLRCNTQQQGQTHCKENQGNRVKETTHSYMEDNTRHTEYPGQGKTHDRRREHTDKESTR